MKAKQSWPVWLEMKGSVPAYGGGVLGAIALCFFGAATNTMSGWLYVLSGLSFALLLVAAWLPIASLRRLQVRRFPLSPVGVGQTLAIELTVTNGGDRPEVLLEVRDPLPRALGGHQHRALEVIPPRGEVSLVFYVTPQRRGVYAWSEVVLRSGAPLGLFWSRRQRSAPAKAIVYPEVLPLSRCPLIDRLGQEDSIRQQSDRLSQNASEGITKTLRPYRLGDSTRLIHWRTSARLGELQVRELEVIMGGQEVTIALDTAIPWSEEVFEQAVTAAASLYFYGVRSQMQMRLWTADQKLVSGKLAVLETLALVQPQTAPAEVKPPSGGAVLWLTCDPQRLPPQGRYLLFGEKPMGRGDRLLGLAIGDREPLIQQLQRSPY